eukprot:8490176-Pyramimonas_sp.AAC.1
MRSLLRRPRTFPARGPARVAAVFEPLLEGAVGRVAGHPRAQLQQRPERARHRRDVSICP